MDSFCGVGRARARRLAATLSAAALVATAGASAETARPADVFVDSLGVNVHLLYANYIDLFDSVVVPRMQEIGIRHYRDGILLDDPPFVARLVDLAAAGARGTFITRPTQFPALITWAKQNARLIDTLEGPNEPHNEAASASYAGLEQPASLKPYQQDLYAAVRAEPALSHVLVATPGIDWFGAYGSVGDLDQWTDLGNFHHWPPSTGLQQGGMNKGNAPTDGLYVDRAGGKGLLDAARSLASTKPLIATETGFATTQLPATQDNGWDPGMSEGAAARYATRVYLELFNQQVKRTFLYELLDEWQSPHPVKQHQGMIRRDGSLKPHAVAIKNLIALLSDPGPAHLPQSLDYELVSTAPLVDDRDFRTAEIHHLLLQKRSGTFYLVLWNEAVSYDNLTELDVTVPDVEVKLTFNAPLARARTFRPLDSTDALTSSDDPTELTLMVPDHPLIVELEPKVADGDPSVAGGGGGGTEAGAAGAGPGAGAGGTSGSESPAVAAGATAAPARPGEGGSGLDGAARPADANGCACGVPARSGSGAATWLLCLLLLLRVCRRARAAVQGG